MLSEKTLNQVKARIDTINQKLKKDAEQALSDGKGYQEVLDQLVKRASNTYSSESKMMLSSVYNALSKETLKTDFFKVTAHETAFNKKNIQRDIENRFTFDVPEKIDIKESYNELLVSGGIILVGGGISICIHSKGPIAIAAILAAIMYFVLKNCKQKSQCQLIDQYLASINSTMVKWVKDIADYYDKQVENLKSELQQQKK